MIIGNNWRLKPLTDIQTTKLTKCPPDYENLIDRTFGTSVGCMCQGTDRNKTTISLGNCNINQTAVGGERVPPIEPTLLSKFYGYKIGGLREGLNFLEAERPARVKNELRGSENKKLGGSGDINTSFCIGMTHSGPINEVFVISKNTPIPPDYSSADLADDNKLVFSTSFNAMPVVRFKLTEGKICFNSENYQISASRYPYKLNLDNYCNKKYRTRATDPRYKQIGQIREDKLFTDNALLDAVAALPEFPIEETTKYMWNLYSSNYFYWSYHCEKNPETSRHNWYSVLQKITDVHNNNNYILATSIFYAIGVGLVVMYFFAYFTIISIMSREEINKPMRNLFVFFGYPIRILAGGFLIYFGYTNITKITHYQEAIISITVAEGAPDFTTQAFFAYEEPLQGVYRMSYRVIILAIMSLLLVLSDLALELGIRGVLKTTYGRFYTQFIE